MADELIICPWKKVYQSQLESEVQRKDVGTKGTQSFRDMGCDNCVGINLECQTYKDFLDMRGIKYDERRKK